MKRILSSIALVLACLVLNACASAKAEYVKPAILPVNPSPSLTKGGGDGN